MSFTSLRELKNELLWFLRNEDVIPVEIRRVETITSTSNVEDVDFFEIEDSQVKNIRHIKLNNELLKFGYQYTYSTENKLLILFNQEITGNLEVVYDTGKDKIFPDFPRGDLNIESYPRIGFDIVNLNTNYLSMGAKDSISDMLIGIVVYGQNLRQVEEIISNIRTKVLKNRKSFFYHKLITVTSVGRTIEGSEKSQVVHKNIDLSSQFVVEEDES